MTVDLVGLCLCLPYPRYSVCSFGKTCFSVCYVNRYSVYKLGNMHFGVHCVPMQFFKLKALF